MNSQFTMTIGGEVTNSESRMNVIDPATGEIFADCPRATQQHLDRAVESATRAFAYWKRTSLVERQQLLIRAAEVIEQHAEEIGSLFTHEQGRPLTTATWEVLGAAACFRSTALMTLPVEITEDTDTRRVEVHHEPLGVVCAIVPWNAPLLLAAWKIAPAMLAGNTMVLKPSPYTPLCTLRIGELLRDVLPPGVLNVISGGDELGPMMTQHPGFAKITFTGSTATGRRVMEAAARDLKRLTLELGGNDAAIVLADVDIDEVAEALFFGAFFNTAQICVATKRLYIHEDIYDRLRDRLHAIALAMKVGDGSEPDSAFGPVQNAPQFRRVCGLIDEARAAGYTLLQGAAVPARGYFVPLTLVDNPPDDSRVVRDEAFGPVLPLLKFKNIDEAIERANHSEYGLAGSVWSKDIGKAIEIAKRLETGTVWINQNLQTTPMTPLAGHKQSGLGVENGQAGLLEFTQPKAIFIPKPKAVE